MFKQIMQTKIFSTKVGIISTKEWTQFKNLSFSYFQILKDLNEAIV